MRVLIDHHSPFLLAHGGFQIQIEQTLRALQEIGVEAEWLRFWDDSQKPDVVHFFGKVHAGYLRFAKQKGIRTVVNELHTGLGSHPEWKKTIQRQVIGLSKRYFPPLASRLNWDNYEYADAIMALTPYEADLMCNIFHAPRARMHVIPNGVNDVFLEPSSMEREDWLLCTAVIHPRKRVLELARAAVIAKTPLRVYGRPYSENDSYFHAFRDVVEKSGGLVRWEGSLSDRVALADVYRRARGFVLPSTMESLSLSALEAAATGCPLLLSDLPWATTTFGSHATYAPNSSDPSVLAASVAAFHREPKSPEGYRVLSWADVARQLKELYASILTR
jgi:glycosyltransferase involved in cell wall biosynthesis